MLYAFISYESSTRCTIWSFCTRRLIHGCESWVSAPVVLHIELHVSRLWGFAPVVLYIVPHVCKSWVSAPVVGFTCADPALLPPSAFRYVVPELRQGPAQLRVLRKRNSSGKASSDAGPELAGRESRVAMESPQALMCPLEKGINKSSSDDRPGPGICDSKYVEDAKAARSVRVWDRVPMKNTRLGGLR